MSDNEEDDHLDVDDDDDEDEEDSEEDKKPQPKKKKIMNAADYFIDNEAAVDEDDEEEDFDEAEDGFIEHEKINHRRAESEKEDMSIYRRRERPNLLSTEKSEAEIEIELAKRYQNYSHDDDEVEDDGEDASDYRQQSLLPGVRDPKLWMVKCKPGKEKHTVMSIMQKYFDKENEPDKLLIKSATAPEHLKGYVYIEAEKESHVKMAIQGLRNLTSFTMVLVPIKEMPEVFTVTKRVAALVRGDWVRMKRGTNKGDIAQIIENDEAKGRVTVKVIPRLDISNRGGGEEKRKRKTVMPARFFNPEEINRNHGNFEKKGDYYIYDGNRYKDGFLIKVVNIKSLETQGIVPTLDEAQKFQEKPNDSEDGSTPLTAMSIPAIKSKRKMNFGKGDSVKVIEGDLKNLTGVVESVAEDGTVTVMPKYEGLTDLLSFPAYQLIKSFKAGDHVKVVSGYYEGETGLLIRVEDNNVVFFSDLTSKEIKVLSQDIQECSDTSTGKLKLGNYELHDLVTINSQLVGVIVKVEKESFKVLDNNGNIQTITLQEIGNKRTMKGVSFDSNNNSIGIDDMVSVKEGPFKGRIGTIKHIFKYYAFLHSRDMLDNSGIFVVRTGMCTLQGANKKKESFSQNSPMNVPMSPAHGHQNKQAGHRDIGVGGRSHGGGGYRRRDTGLLGKTVIINKGQWKGYEGIVKDSTETTARVELHTNCKTVTISRESLILKVETGSENNQIQPNVSENDYGKNNYPQTPMRGEDGSQTPLRSAPSTPNRGWGSSAFGASTPVHGTAWDPMQPNTPMRNTGSSWEDSYSSNNNSSWTPNNEYASVSTPGSNYGSGSYGFSPFSPARGAFNNNTDNHTPVENNPLTPSSGFTPSSNFTNENNTPSSSYYNDQRTPQDSTPYTPIPYQSTPLTPSPNTPLLTPHTPGTPSNTIPTPMDTSDSTSWASEYIEVTISDAFKSGSFRDKIGWIRTVFGDSCKVEFDGGDQQSIPIEMLTPTAPKRKDEVKVIKGDMVGSTGTLIGIDGADGIVKMAVNLDIKILDLHLLGVIHSNR